VKSDWNPGVAFHPTIFMPCSTMRTWGDVPDTGLEENMGRAEHLSPA
jgi:hypothetical protein